MADIAITAAQIEPIDLQNAEIHQFIAAETLTKGQAVYVVTTSGKVGVADANVANKQQIRGLALAGAGAGEGVSVLKRGKVAGFTLTSQDYDDPIFLSDTAGALADAAGTLTVPCGLVVAQSDNDLTKCIYLDCRWGADYV